MNTPTVIAEIGCVHAGDIKRAKELITLAAKAGANYAKFQKRCPKESTPRSLWDQPHPNQKFAYGKTYLEHRIALEFTKEQHADLKTFCEQQNIGYSTSVWDLTSAKEIVDLNPTSIKIPSAQNHNIELLDFLYNNYKGQIHISLGMTTPKERKTLENYVWKYGGDGVERTVIYHCTSAYPCPFENLYLNEIKELKKQFLNVGFSNHGYGIAADVAALAFGATWFERHFVDDRMFPHTDASASLEPEGLRKLVRDLNNVQKAFQNKPDRLDELETVQRNKLRG